jgi:hypothetical protein
MSRWSFSFVVAQGNNGHYDRVVVDFRGLNSVLRIVDCVLSTAEDILSRLEGNCFFSIIDLAKGCYQIRADDSTAELLTVRSVSGKYSFVVLELGPANSVAEIVF